jgi:hypothetical protein
MPAPFQDHSPNIRVPTDQICYMHATQLLTFAQAAFHLVGLALLAGLERKGSLTVRSSSVLSSSAPVVKTWRPVALLTATVIGTGSGLNFGRSNHIINSASYPAG